jgi:hypothetical protein
MTNYDQNDKQVDDDGKGEEEEVEGESRTPKIIRRR